jgi:hypothetical protein
MYEESFNEYGDFDAISCANGDYNAHEEHQCFLDQCLERDEPEYFWDMGDDYLERDDEVGFPDDDGCDRYDG